MRCPSCSAPCLADDVICPTCRRPFSEIALRSRSAMWFTTPLFLAIGVILFVALPLYTPRGIGSTAEWAKINVGAMVAGGSALVGAVVGWLLDWIAHMK